MGKTIEVRLSDAQHAQLSAEAEAASAKFFEYCRMKLTALNDMPEPTEREPELRPARLIAPNGREYAVKPAILTADDRISRIEDAVARLTDYVLQGHAAPEAQPQQPQAPIDVDSIVDSQFREAEAAGLTEHVPDEAEQQMAESGVRSLSRRPMPYSTANVPRHLQQLLG